MPYSTKRAIVIGCVVIALLALPFIGMAHCEVAHAVDGHAPAPLAEACCVFVCLTMLISALALHRGWMSIAHVMFDLTPVRLVRPLTRWVPPPRPIALLP
ncbi:MAG: hypothetical protein HGB05_16310 [Chloroflexi bacterium]|nr:hypothetical protein [Chloroflexota bacterium]